MEKEKFVAVPVDLMNQLLQYLTEQRYKDVHLLIQRISSECRSVDSFSEEPQASGEALAIGVEE